MSTIWEHKTVAINPLVVDNEILGYAIVSKNQKYFYGSDVNIDSLLEDCKARIEFEGIKYNFRALYYQMKPAIKFQTLADIVKQEYFTTSTQDIIYFDRPEGARQAVVEAVFMLEFFLKNYKKRNKAIYDLDKQLLYRTNNYKGEILVNEVKVRTELSLLQKQQWDIERELFKEVGFPVQNIIEVPKEQREDVEDYFEKIKNCKQKYEELIQYFGISKLKLEFNVTSTATGRILCRDRENKIGLFTPDKQYRELFYANSKDEIDYKFISADYIRQEATILATVSEDEQLLEDIQDDDFYSRLARWTIRNTSKQIGKTLFYAVIYGSKASNLANELNISETEAIGAINKIKKRYSDLNYWLKHFNENTNYFGRPLHQNTINAYMQSTAADIVRDRLLATFHLHPVLVLSDNIIYLVKKNSLEEIKNIIQILLQNTKPFNLKVKLKSSYNLLFN